MGKSLENAQGRLGELAGYAGKPDDWLRTALLRMNDLYMADTDVMITKTKRAALDVRAGVRGADAQLEELQRDYASFWLIKKLIGQDMPPLQEQGKIWHSAMIAAPDRQLALTLAVAGFDIVVPRMGDHSPILHGFTFCAHEAELDEFIGYIPPVHRAALINQTSDDAMTVMHVASFAANPGCVALLHEQGGNPALLMDVPLLNGEKIKANCAHVAVLNGRPDMTAELIALDRSLFARESAEVRYRPDELIELLYKRAPHEVSEKMRMAANLAAYAVDRPLPFAEQAWVLNKLAPQTAPQPILTRNSFN